MGGGIRDAVCDCDAECKRKRKRIDSLSGMEYLWEAKLRRLQLSSKLKNIKPPHITIKLYSILEENPNAL